MTSEQPNLTANTHDGGLREFWQIYQPYILLEVTQARRTLVFRESVLSEQMQPRQRRGSEISLNPIDTADAHELKNQLEGIKAFDGFSIGGRPADDLWEAFRNAGFMHDPCRTPDEGDRFGKCSLVNNMDEAALSTTSWPRELRFPQQVTPTGELMGAIQSTLRRPPPPHGSSTTLSEPRQN